jgi:hypothetical protein
MIALDGESCSSQRARRSLFDRGDRYHLRWSAQQRAIGVACESHCDGKVSPDRVDAQTVANSPQQVKSIQN